MKQLFLYFVKLVEYELLQLLEFFTASCFFPGHQVIEVSERQAVA